VFQNLRNSEIAHLDGSSSTDEDVLSFEVAVKDAIVVNVRQAHENLNSPHPRYTWCFTTAHTSLYISTRDTFRRALAQ
jgi:hypothetical protein